MPPQPSGSRSYKVAIGGITRDVETALTAVPPKGVKANVALCVVLVFTISIDRWPESCVVVKDATLVVVTVENDEVGTPLSRWNGNSPSTV